MSLICVYQLFCLFCKIYDSCLFYKIFISSILIKKMGYKRSNKKYANVNLSILFYRTPKVCKN